MTASGRTVHERARLGAEPATRDLGALRASAPRSDCRISASSSTTRTWALIASSHHGDDISNVAPGAPSRLPPARPPCSTTMFWLTANPRPCPLGLVVKNGLKIRRGLRRGRPALILDDSSCVLATAALPGRAGLRPMRPPSASPAAALRTGSPGPASSGADDLMGGRSAACRARARARFSQLGSDGFPDGVEEPPDRDGLHAGCQRPAYPTSLRTSCSTREISRSSACALARTSASDSRGPRPHGPGAASPCSCRRAGSVLVRELGGELAHGRQLLALHQPPPLFDQRRVGLLDARDHLM